MQNQVLYRSIHRVWSNSLPRYYFTTINPNFNPQQQKENKLNLNPNNVLNKEEYFQQFQMYRKHSQTQLLNLLFCSHILQYETIVKNSEKLYLNSKNIFGSYLTNNIIEKTVGKVFTGGSQLSNIEQVKQDLAKKNVGLIINYCDEANGVRTEQEMDRSTELFVESIKAAQQCDSNIGVKYSGICDMDTMKKLNILKRWQNQIFHSINLTNDIYQEQSAFSVYQQLQQSNIECTEQEFKEFLSEILDIKNVTCLKSLKLTRLQWESCVHPYYIEESKNNNSIIKKMTNYNSRELELMNNIVNRLNLIYQQASVKPSSRIYVDAEQSFLQYFIESISWQYQLKYNKQEPMIYSTIQCYLKDSQDKLNMELAKQNYYGVSLGLKLVKGAYYNEEILLQDKDNLQNSFEDTAKCYVNISKQVIQNLNKNNNEILIGLHNIDNVEEIKQFMEQNNIDKSQVHFAQLLGMADCITYSLSNQGFKTSKYVPFGRTEIMIPYLCRRAYEGFKFLSTVKLQEFLIKDEIKNRIFRKNKKQQQQINNNQQI